MESVKGLVILMQFFLTTMSMYIIYAVYSAKSYIQNQIAGFVEFMDF